MLFEDLHTDRFFQKNLYHEDDIIDNDRYHTLSNNNINNNINRNDYNNNDNSNNDNTQISESSFNNNKKIVFDQDGNLLKSFDYIEETFYKRENYIQADFKINLSDINGNSTSKSKSSSNEKSSNINKLPSVIDDGNIMKNTNSKMISGKISEKRDMPFQKLEKIHTNSNITYNEQYRNSNKSGNGSILTIFKNNDIVLQPLHPGSTSNLIENKNRNNGAIGIDKKSISLPYSSLVPLETVTPNQYSINQTKSGMNKTSRINTLLNDFKNGKLKDYSFLKTDHSIKNCEDDNDILNLQNNNKNQIEKRKENKTKTSSKSLISSSVSSQLQNQSPLINKNSILYLQNEETNTKSKSNFKSWIITNFAKEWEDQPWISLKCPTYNDDIEEKKEEEEIENPFNTSVNSTKKEKDLLKGVIESVPLKIAYLSQTIQHIYRNSSK